MKIRSIVISATYGFKLKKTGSFMRSVRLEYSKSKIDKAGDVLKDKASTSAEITASLNVLSNWRAYHAKPLDKFATKLRERSQKISGQAIVAQRL